MKKKQDTLKSFALKRLRAIKREIDKLEVERKQLQEIIKPSHNEVIVEKKEPVINKKVNICLYEHTRNTVGTQFDIPFININNNKDITMITKDLIKNGFDINIYDDSINDEGKEILTKFSDWLKEVK